MHDESMLIPLGALLVAIVAIVSGVVGNAHQRRLRAEQRMAMLQRGMQVADIERLLGGKDEPDRPRDPLRRLANTRTTAMVLISLAFGGILFFILVSVLEHEHSALSGAAACLVPLSIGLGFALDYRLQAQDVARLGLDLPATDRIGSLRDRSR